VAPWRRLGWIAAARRKAFPMKDLLLDGWSRSIARTSEGPQHSHFPRPALLRSIACLSLFILGHKMPAGPFTLRQLADTLEVDANTVRVLLRFGVLQSPQRQPGRSGDGAFHQEHVERLRFIKQALGVGFHLDDIARLVDPSGLITCGDVYALTSQRVKEMRRTREDARSLEDLIRECRVRSQEGLIHPCPAKGGRKDCRILVKLRATSVADQE